MPVIQSWSDASIRGDKAGYAYVIRREPGGLSWTAGGVFVHSPKDILEAEMMAVANTLAAIVTHCGPQAGGCTIFHGTDNKDVVRILKDPHVAKEGTTIEKVVQYIQSLGLHVCFHWVPGHRNGDSEMFLCDAISGFHTGRHSQISKTGEKYKCLTSSKASKKKY